MSIEYFRKDPIFKLETPLLFAHRGGAREMPESTVKGFTHALETAKTDVLELDVQLTKDGEFVVWHGPELNNVRIECESDRPIERPRDRKKIYHFYHFSAGHRLLTSIMSSPRKCMRNW